MKPKIIKEVSWRGSKFTTKIYVVTEYSMCLVAVFWKRLGRILNFQFQSLSKYFDGYFSGFMGHKRGRHWDRKRFWRREAL